MKELILSDACSALSGIQARAEADALRGENSPTKILQVLRNSTDERNAEEAVGGPSLEREYRLRNLGVDVVDRFVFS